MISMQASAVLNVVRLPHKMCSHRLSSDVLLKTIPNDFRYECVNDIHPTNHKIM